MGVPNIENLKPAPRKIPFRLKLQLIFDRGVVQIMWIFSCAFFVSFWLFSSDYDWNSLRYVATSTEYSQGEVYHSYFVGNKLGKKSIKYSNDNLAISIYANYYKFSRNNIIYKGISYSSYFIKNGTLVTIEYPQGSPEISKIKGLKNTILEDSDIRRPWIMLIGFILAFIILIYNIRVSLNWMKLLENGIVGYGKLEEDKDLAGISQLPGIFRGKNESVQFYPLVFRYQGLNRLTYKVKIVTTEPELLQDEELEQLIYDPNNPSNAVLLDAIPGGIVVDSDGNICPNNISVAFYFLVIPLATTMTATYVILKYVL